MLETFILGAIAGIAWQLAYFERQAKRHWSALFFFVAGCVSFGYMLFWKVLV